MLSRRRLLCVSVAFLCFCVLAWAESEETQPAGEVMQAIQEEVNAKLEELGPQDLAEGLCFAAAEGNVAQVLDLLDRGADPNAQDRLRTSALHHAADFGHAEVIRILVLRGGDPNGKGLLGVTPLMLAAGKGHAEVVKALIEAGADVHAKAETGSTALMRAEQREHAEVVEMLKQAGALE